MFCLPTEADAVWMAALQSGEYRPTQKRLRRPEKEGGGFCCLGVGCDLVDPEGWEETENGDMFYRDPEYGVTRDAMPPASVERIFGWDMELCHNVTIINDEPPVSSYDGVIEYYLAQKGLG